jgi:hypothetical protein
VVQVAVVVAVEVALLKQALRVQQAKVMLAVMVKQAVNNMLRAVVAVLVRLAAMDQLLRVVRVVRELHLPFRVHQ